jgi:hypothetical protein
MGMGVKKGLGPGRHGNEQANPYDYLFHGGKFYTQYTQKKLLTKFICDKTKVLLANFSVQNKVFILIESALKKAPKDFSENGNF